MTAVLVNQSIHDHPEELQDDQYTVAETASTSYSVQSNYTTGTVGSYVPLSRLSKHSVKLRTTSSFPSILNLYHEPIKEEEPTDSYTSKNKSRRRHFDKKSKKNVKNNDWDAIIEPRNTQEQRAIKIEAVAREQMEKYEKYIANLKAKVEKQRDERKKQCEELQERLKIQEEEKNKYHLKRPKREYIHDRTYLKKLPQSNFCKMVRLSDDLSKKGVLKTKTDVDHFWKDFGQHGVDRSDIFARDPLTEVHLSNMYTGKKAPLAALDINKSGYPGHKGKQKKKKKQLSSDFDPSSIPSIEIHE